MYIRWNLGIRDTQGTVPNCPEFCLRWSYFSNPSQVVPISQVVLKTGLTVYVIVCLNSYSFNNMVVYSFVRPFVVRAIVRPSFTFFYFLSSALCARSSLPVSFFLLNLTHWNRKLQSTV